MDLLGSSSSFAGGKRRSDTKCVTKIEIWVKIERERAE